MFEITIVTILIITDFLFEGVLGSVFVGLPLEHQTPWHSCGIVNIPILLVKVKSMVGMLVPL